MGKMRGNGYKLFVRFRLDAREKFFITRTISHWNNLREVVNSPALDTSKIQMDMVKGHLF